MATVLTQTARPVDVPARAAVLVTGGWGFIGGHLVAHLAARGATVTVLDLDGGPPVPPPGVTSVRGDVRDLDLCLDLVADRRPDLVFHLAASSTIDSAYEDPHASLAVNAGGTTNLLEAVRRAGGVGRFVHASTDKVYGELRGPSYREDSPLQARGVYDVGKLAADQVTRLYGYELGVPVAVLRLCNVFGPGDANTAYRIVPRSLDRLLGPGGPLPPVVYEGSMGHSRDYVFVEDVVRALVVLAQDRRARGGVFNMAPTAHRTTLALVEELIDAAAAGCAPHDPARAAAIRRNGYEVAAGGAPASVLVRQHGCAERLRELGFRPEVGMAEGLRRTVAAVLGERHAVAG
jgi:nucleoside-diphosphate-sugar epimerase